MFGFVCHFNNLLGFLSSGIQVAEDFLVDIGEFFEGFEVDNVLLVTQEQLLWGLIAPKR